MSIKECFQVDQETVFYPARILNGLKLFVWPVQNPSQPAVNKTICCDEPRAMLCSVFCSSPWGMDKVSDVLHEHLGLSHLLDRFGKGTIPSA